MKSLLFLSMLILSFNGFSQSDLGTESSDVMGGGIPGDTSYDSSLQVDERGKIIDEEREEIRNHEYDDYALEEAIADENFREERMEQAPDRYILLESEEAKESWRSEDRTRSYNARHATNTSPDE